MSIKPILFNTDMVRGLQANRKTATRRVVKPKYSDSVFEMFRGQLCEASPDKPPRDNGDGTTTHFVRNYVPCKPPYRPGDILYVRETWSPVHVLPKRYLYKADADSGVGEGVGLPIKWHPSIHMPREVARIFLRVTDVRVERLQDITNEDARKEGCSDREDFRRVWNDCYAKPRPVKDENGIIDHYESYPWEDIQETRTYRGKPWYVIGNPWVWVIEFERISREEAMQHG